MIDLNYYIEKFKEDKLEEVFIHLSFNQHWGDTPAATFVFEEEGNLFLKVGTPEDEARQSVANLLEIDADKLPHYEGLLIEYYNFPDEDNVTLHVMDTRHYSFRMRKFLDKKGYEVYMRAEVLKEGYFGLTADMLPSEPAGTYLLSCDEKGSLKLTEIDETLHWGMVK